MRTLGPSIFPGGSSVNSVIRAAVSVDCVQTERRALSSGSCCSGFVVGRLSPAGFLIAMAAAACYCNWTRDLMIWVGGGNIIRDWLDEAKVKWVAALMSRRSLTRPQETQTAGPRMGFHDEEAGWLVG
ncbi:hypothetical protein AMECASPLE_033295 [Ameca splendens]|uniref:Uncharacterized protein n=1 Tax=Ameca splendens TaxID=208324 RepID=A0ABV0ZRQ9_9TELE